MKYKIEYSPLNYYHSQVSDECLCLGVLFHNITTDQRDFYSISNFKRFQAFDDEADVDFIKAYLKSIKNDILPTMYSDGETFSVEEYKKIFVNDFRFQKTITVTSDNYKSTIEDIYKVYLKYDLEQKKRLSTANEKEVIKHILLANKLNYSTGKIKGLYDDDINFDYMADNLYVKYFSFNSSNLRKYIPVARQWSFAAEEVKESGKVLFIYDSDTYENNDLKIILSILGKNAKTTQLSEASEVLQAYI